MTNAARVLLTILAVLPAIPVIPGCAGDDKSTAPVPSDPLPGYWSFVRATREGATWEADGDEVYWVIDGDRTVCTIERISGGAYVEYPSFIYERDDSLFTARYDLDPVPAPEPAQSFAYSFSAGRDTLYLDSTTVEGGDVVLVRRATKPDCCCNPVP